MKTLVQKWGNSLALRIPKAMAEQIHVKAGAPVEILEDGGRLMIRPTGGRVNLKTLLSKITSENLHAETETGDAAGKEVW